MARAFCQLSTRAKQWVLPDLASIGALANGVGVQTYCKGKSKAPRGDLFDQLPAYKGNHPSQTGVAI
jgi:hypothetical protein